MCQTAFEVALSTEHTNPHQVQRQFGTQAALYANTTVHGTGDTLEAMVKLASPGRYNWAVDIACGAGYTGLALRPYVSHSVLMDITRQMLQQSRLRASERGLNDIRYVQGASQALPFADGSMGMVSCRFAAHHFDPIETVLSDVRRVLKRRGVLLLADTVPTEDDDVACWMNDVEKRRDSTHVRNYRPSEWLALVQAHKLTVTHSVPGRVNLEFCDWVKRSGTPEREVASLRGDFLAAPPAVKEAFGISGEAGGRLPFYWPCVAIRALKL
jgi:ubiquinone/menaquinone biosynthesis C-methylase UbiE